MEMRCRARDRVRRVQWRERASGKCLGEEADGKNEFEIGMQRA